MIQMESAVGMLGLFELNERVQSRPALCGKRLELTFVVFRRYKD